MGSGMDPFFPLFRKRLILQIVVQPVIFKKNCRQLFKFAPFKYTRMLAGFLLQVSGYLLNLFLFFTDLTDSEPLQPFLFSKTQKYRLKLEKIVV